ncbi:MAG: TRAM domain-containing protein, partial [Oscillospiraceae bacterium]
MRKNDIVTMDIIDVSNDGNGIGRYENLVVFVPFSVTGDVLSVRIVKVLKSYAFGIIDEILTPSPKRAKNQICEIFGKCGGCSLGHIDYAEEVKIKNGWVYGNMKKIGKTEFEPVPPIPSVSAEEYRNKAIYPLGINENGRIVAGFYAKRSHRIVPADNCPLHPRFFGVILNAFTDWANENK